jgi:hypothetical protein
VIEEGAEALDGREKVLYSSFYGGGCQDASLPFAECFHFCTRRPLLRVSLIGSHLQRDPMTHAVFAAQTMCVSIVLDSFSFSLRCIC